MIVSTEFNSSLGGEEVEGVADGGVVSMGLRSSSLAGGAGGGGGGDVESLEEGERILGLTPFMPTETLEGTRHLS